MNSIEQTYWIARPGAEADGPFTFSQVEHLWKSGGLTADAMIRPTDVENWTPLIGAMAAVEKVRERGYHMGLYRVLGLFFGLVGAHNLYAGEVKQAVYKIVFFLVSALLMAMGSGLEALGWMIVFSLAILVFAEVVSGGYSTSVQDDRSLAYPETPAQEKIRGR